MIERWELCCICICIRGAFWDLMVYRIPYCAIYSVDSGLEKKREFIVSMNYLLQVKHNPSHTPTNTT